MNHNHLKILDKMAEHSGKVVKKIAVDFDGTLCQNAYPNIGSPNIQLIEFLKDARTSGVAVILNTLREHVIEYGELMGRDLLQEAIDWCKTHGLEFDAHNENYGTEEMVAQYGWVSRKIAADFYIDDRNLIFSTNNMQGEIGFHAGKGYMA